MSAAPGRAAAPPTEAELVLARVRIRARLRAEWLRHLWAEESGGGPGGLHAELDARISGADSPAAEAEWLASEPRFGEWRAALADVEATLAGVADSRFALLERVLGIEPADADLLQASLAAALDPGLARVFAYLQEHAGRGYVTAELAARLFGHGRTGPWTAESALFRWELVAEREMAPGEPAALACDPHLRDWLLGRDSLDGALVGIARIQPPLPPLESWPIDDVMGFLDRTVNGAGARVRVWLAGPAGSGRRTLAAVVAARFGLPLLAVDADAVEDHDWRRVHLRAQRQAYLDRSALAWHGESLARRPWPRGVEPFPVQFLVVEPGQAVPPAPGTVDHLVEMPALDVEDRRALWRAYVPASESWPAERLDALAAGARVTVGDIVAAGGKGVDSPASAALVVREAARGRLGGLAQRLECPFGWDDLVVADPVRATLEDLAYEAATRTEFWEQPAARRLFPQGRGLIALFSGPPGTGKTMAAQVVAARLGLDLYRIDLSALVSKYVGETAENIEKLLRRASSMDAVLLFDEADAIYGKRATEIRDAQDRFANMDTGHLMVAIESYDGIVLLSTNLKSNIDPAFLRRIRYLVDFPKPDAAQRLEIWHRIIGELAGGESLAAVDAELTALAAGVDATGSQIKFGVLAALFAARREGRPLGIDHLIHGLNRELVKEGRSLSGRERGRLLNGR